MKMIAIVILTLTLTACIGGFSVGRDKDGRFTGVQLTGPVIQNQLKKIIFADISMV